MPTLAASKVPVFLLPGNHDRYEGLLKRAGGTRFFGYFSEKYWPSTARVRAYPLLELDGERLAVVGADLCLTNTLLDAGWRRGGKWAWLGQGRAHPAVLRAMVDETTRVRRERGPVAVVWAVHFPPRFHGLDGDLVLLQEDDLLEAAREAEVNHLFCGHTHQARSYPAGAGLDVYCAGTATQYVAPWGNTLHPIDIEVTGGQVRAVSWQTVTWNEDLGDFV
jgi:3',5'-cyclic AMP phosphodiesterase CpdA